MFDLPNDERLYEALLARDADFDGRAYVGVTSTGVFCRLTCPARKPKRENCRFHSNIAACLEAGFRPCKRCHPMAPAAQGDPAVQALLAALEAAPERRWSEREIAAMGYDPSTVRRSFKRHFGMSFIEMARLARLRQGAALLPKGGKVIDAQLEAGFASASAFRAAMGRWLGLPPGAFVKDAMLRADMFDTKLGPMVVVASASHVHLLEFAERKALPREVKQIHAHGKGQLGFGRFAISDLMERELDDFLSGREAAFTAPLAPLGGPFAQQVWRALREIPPGETRSYGALAAALGQPNGARAVARANGANPIAIAIPCHRVLGADGGLTGYGGGLWRKQALIELERGFGARRNMEEG